MSILRLSTGESVSKWCRRNGVSYNKVWGRLEAGLTPDEAAEYALKGYKKGETNRKHFYKGKWVGDIFPRNSKAYSRILHRIQKGYTLEQAVEKEVLPDELCETCERSATE